MNLLDVCLASAGFAAVAIVKGRDGVRLVAAPEMTLLPQGDQVRLMVDGAAALLAAAQGLKPRPPAG